jgi:hypothetical protein
MAREIARYKLDLVGVQEVWWDKRGSVRVHNCIFSMEQYTTINNWEQVMENFISDQTDHKMHHNNVHFCYVVTFQEVVLFPSWG